MNDKLQRKVERAINLIKAAAEMATKDGQPLEVSYSGGKDSDVILELTKMAGVNYRAIYKNTTIDPPGTIKHCKDNGVTILQPKMSFLQIVEQKGTPSRFARFCCEILKEYKVYDRAIQGIRRCESVARTKRYKEPEICRVYSKDEKVRVYLPILEWTDDDVAQFIQERGIKCAPVYYDENGQFHVERRLGCIGCPLSHKNGLREFEQYPKLFRQIVKSQQRFYDTHTSAGKAFDRNVYNLFYYKFFCKDMNDYLVAITGGLFPEEAIDTQKFLSEYFEISL